MDRIFSGVQPTGKLHLGNYLGAIRNFVDLQNKYECIYCVVDLHAITVWQDPVELASNTREVTASFLAAGINPKSSIIFNQSQVLAHAQLAWIFNCVARLKEMGLPFTLFVATKPIDQNFNGYMSWDQIRELREAGVTIGSQTNSHLHMAAASETENRIDLKTSNARFQTELGDSPKIIAYPYGEYSLSVGKLSQEAGFQTGFGQHSGVLHAEADMLYLPRWAMNENYGDINRFKMAINALPLTIGEVTPADPSLSRPNNPPLLGFTVKGPAAKNLSRLACYASRQGKVRIERLGPRAEIRLKVPFASGRARVNCTMPTPSGRWRWHGFQFYVPPS